MKRLEILLSIMIALLLANLGLNIWLLKRTLRGSQQLQKMTIKSEVPLPEVIRKVEPEYPKDLRKKGIEGQVILKVKVDTTGKVEEVLVARSSGYREMDSSAIKAVKEWVFKPAETDGVKVTSWVTIPFMFRLQK